MSFGKTPTPNPPSTWPTSRVCHRVQNGLMTHGYCFVKNQSAVMAKNLLNTTVSCPKILLLRMSVSHPIDGTRTTYTTAQNHLWYTWYRAWTADVITGCPQILQPIDRGELVNHHVSHPGTILAESPAAAKLLFTHQLLPWLRGSVINQLETFTKLRFPDAFLVGAEYVLYIYKYIYICTYRLYMYMYVYVYTFGSFLTWGCPQIIQNCLYLVLKPIILAIPHFRKPPYKHLEENQGSVLPNGILTRTKHHSSYAYIAMRLQLIHAQTI